MIQFIYKNVITKPSKCGKNSPRDFDNLQVIYSTSSEDLVKNIEKLKNAGIQPQTRPKGKY